MEIWYVKETLEVKAIYSGGSSSDVWSDLGYQVYVSGDKLPGDIVPGATILFQQDGKPSLVTSPPPVLSEGLSPRLTALYSKLKEQDLTFPEMQEMLRLERNYA